jgi:transcriptional regulator with XRE-family HTH domain
LAALARVSSTYLSQIERGLHEPSVRVLRSIARALNISAESLLESAGLLASGPQSEASGTEAAIRVDRALTDEQKHDLVSVYRSFRQSDRPKA